MWTGTIIDIGSIGNLVTNFRADEVKALSEKAKAWIALPGRPETIRGISKSYEDVAVGKMLVMEGSNGFLEVSVRDGDASKTLGLKRGDRLTLHFRT